MDSVAVTYVAPTNYVFRRLRLSEMYYVYIWQVTVLRYGKFDTFVLL